MQSYLEFEFYRRSLPTTLESGAILQLTPDSRLRVFMPSSVIAAPYEIFQVRIHFGGCLEWRGRNLAESEWHLIAED